MSIAFDSGGARILQGDVLAVLRELPADTYNCIVTSPPYWALRSYLKADSPLKQHELGSEPTPAAFIENMVAVFRECRRVLHPTGQLWVNIGDTYAGGGCHHGDNNKGKSGTNMGCAGATDRFPDGFQSGEPVGIPDMLKNALRADGWRHRDSIIWAKPSPMPASLAGWRWTRCRVKVKALGRAKNTGRDGDLASQGAGVGARAQREEYKATKNEAWADCPGCDKCRANGGYVLRKGQWRTTTAHEHLYMFVKSEKYFADAVAVKEPCADTEYTRSRYKYMPSSAPKHDTCEDSNREADTFAQHFGNGTRNPRSVQTWGPEPCKFSHYASYPSALPRFAIRCSTSPKGCCPACGVPWSPVVETERSFESGSGRSGRDPVGKNGEHMQGGGETRDVRRGPVVTTTAIGYRPSCSCPPAPAVPCRVLDPFAGTATSLVAALDLGCVADGIELNPDYVGYAIERLSAYLVPKGQAVALDGTAGPLFGDTR